MKKHKLGSKVVYRCTSVAEVLDRITDLAVNELFTIMARQSEEQKSGLVNGIPYIEWVDKYCINPYRISDDQVEFHVADNMIVYLLDKDNKIKFCVIRKLNGEQW